MTIQQLAQHIQAQILAPGDSQTEVTSGYVCDLLSWVMANGRQDMAWVTVQTHLNVIAVASLHDMACVILPDSIGMEEAVLKKAVEEDIAVLSSPLSAYDICGLLYREGLLGPKA